MSTAFQVHVAAKSGTSWRVLAQDVDASLAQFLQEDAKRKDCSVAIASSPKFERVVFVLGTHDVPKHNAKDSTWKKLFESIVTVIKTMEKDVQKSQSPTPGLQSVFVTTPFNFDKGCATDSFINLLRKCCQNVGASYVQVPWAEEHKQKPESTATPDKHFNAAGITLLTNSILDMHKKISNNSGSSIIYTPAAPAAPATSAAVPGICGLDSTLGFP